jgi:hypothetical protein
MGIVEVVVAEGGGEATAVVVDETVVVDATEVGGSALGGLQAMSISQTRTSALRTKGLITLP